MPIAFGSRSPRACTQYTHGNPGQRGCVWKKLDASSHSPSEPAGHSKSMIDGSRDSKVGQGQATAFLWVCV